MERHGWRFVYDQDGIIVYSEGQAEGDLRPRKEWHHLGFAEFEYGELNLEKYDISHFDIETGKPILVERPALPETDEQRRIRELEDALLLQAENEIGGIL